MQINRCISCQAEIAQYPCPHCGFDAAGYQQPGYALPCGHILHGRYLIGRVLGQGGFGITYVGWDLVLQYKCAIKEYYPSGQVMRKSTIGLNLEWNNTAPAQSLRREGIESFLKEARKMNRVDHVPGVVRVRDTFIENETAYIVMDYVEGETLKSRLDRNGVLTWAEAEKIFLPAIAAMEQVHRAGLIHRDLSPDNLMLLPGGDVKILDLGAAKDLSVNSGASSMQVAKGGFSPLEQYTQRGGSGPWSDVYAMAATMYYALTGKLPPTAVDRIENDTIAWDLPQLKALPRGVLAALQKAMAVTAQKRTQSMGELLKQLKAAPKPKPPKPPKPPKEPKPPKPPRVKKEKPPKEPERKPIPKKLRILAAVLALAILGGLIYNARPAPGESQLAAPGETTLSTEQTVSTESTELSHIHNWAPATAGSPARCSECGIMTGTALPRTIDGYGDIVGVKDDGTTVAQQSNGWPSYANRGWEDIASVSGGCGIRTDGTVAIDEYYFKNHMKWATEPVKSWTNIAKVSMEWSHISGLRRDGTVVTVEDPRYDDARLHTEDWTDIVDVVAGVFDYGAIPYTVGLKADGTLVIASEEDVFPEAQTWQNIVSLSASDETLLGLKADGTVCVENMGWNPYRSMSAETEAQIEAWTDIVQIDGGWYAVAGLKADGTVVAEPIPSGSERWDTFMADYVDILSNWTDIVAICGVGSVGLKSDGTTVSVTGNEQDGATENLISWTGIKVPKWEPPVEESAEIQHVHTWAPATAGRPARCSECGIMTGTALPQTIVAGNANGLVYGVKNDDTVAELFTYSFNVPPDVKQWKDIASICKGHYFVYGIRNDGTVAYVHDDTAAIPIDGWTDIASVTDSQGHVAGLRRDGTVVTERISYDQYTIVEGDAFAHTESWKDIVAVEAGALTNFDPVKNEYTYNSVYTYVPYTIGLNADGTLVFAAEDDLFPEARGWTDLVAVTATDRTLLGLKADGTVVAVWDEDVERSGISAESRARIEAWTDIVQIDCDSRAYWNEGQWRTESTVAGLKSDGTVVMEASWAGDFSRNAVKSWTDMVAVSADTHVVMGLRSNGSTANISVDYNQKTKTQNYLWNDIKAPTREPEAPTVAETVPSETVENKAILDISNVTFTYEPGEMANNPGSAGTMWVKYKVNGPKEVATVDFTFGFHEPPTQADIEDMVIQIIQARNAGIYKPTLCKTPFWDNIGYPTYPERGSTQYIAFMGFDKDNNFVGYTVIPEEIPQS